MYLILTISYGTYIVHSKLSIKCLNFDFILFPTAKKGMTKNHSFFLLKTNLQSCMPLDEIQEPLQIDSRFLLNT